MADGRKRENPPAREVMGDCSTCGGIGYRLVGPTAQDNDDPLPSARIVCSGCEGDGQQ